MKKLASTFPNMLLSLTLICLVMGAVLGLVKYLTDKPIAKAEQETKTAALKEVLPPFDNDPLSETQMVGLKEDGTDSVRVYKATNGGELVGYAIETFTKNGFGGRFNIMLGITADSSIKDFVVLSHAETPGLGAKMQEWFRLPALSSSSIRDMRGVNLASEMPLTVTKDGGKVDAITASTITSRAFIDAIRRAYEVFKIVNASGTASNGATQEEAAAVDTTQVDSTTASTPIHEEAKK